MRIALVVYDGVLDDECVAFRSVLELIADAEFVVVASRAGPVAGPGGRQVAEVAFDRIDHADVVVVPGGLGCERAADDPALRDFLARMEQTAHLLAASSTGSVVLAAAGVLHGEPAATHWLAGRLLTRYGSEPDDRRLVEHGNVITCEGRVSAVDAAFAIVERVAGPDEADRIRDTLLHRGQPLLRTPTWRERMRARRRHRGAEPAPTEPSAEPPAEPPVTPLTVMVELVDDAEVARQMRRRAARSHRR